MWLCRYCAAHVPDDVLRCPCCGTAGPARLHPELRANVSETSHYSPPSPRQTFLMNRVIPSIEKRVNTRAVKAGAILGFSLPFIGFAIGFIMRPRWATISDISPMLCYSIPFAFFGAVFFGCAAVILRALKDWLASIMGRTEQQPSLPPHSALAKTDALGRNNPVTGEHCEGILDPQQSSSCLAITDGESDIQAGDPDPVDDRPAPN